MLKSIRIYRLHASGNSDFFNAAAIHKRVHSDSGYRFGNADLLEFRTVTKSVIAYSCCPVLNNNPADPRIVIENRCGIVPCRRIPHVIVHNARAADLQKPVFIKRIRKRRSAFARIRNGVHIGAAEIAYAVCVFVGVPGRERLFIGISANGTGIKDGSVFRAGWLLRYKAAIRRVEMIG